MSTSVSARQPQQLPSDTSRQFPWVPLLWFTGLLSLVYGSTIQAMVHEWATEDEMGHGFFVPVIAAYIVWLQRDRILNTPIKPNWWGIVLIVWSFIQLILGTFGADFFLARSAFLISLVGVVLTVGGVALLRNLLFPLFLLLFMIRIPQFIYSQITFPLQIFASKVAELVLSGIGIPVLREGNILELPNQRLSVVEACSGIRSLLSLTFLSLVYGYFFDNKRWMRFVLLISAVPIAITANAGRVTITGIVGEYKKELAEGIYHSLEGWVIFMLALIGLLITHQLLNRLYALTHGRK